MCLTWPMTDNGLCIGFYVTQVIISSLKIAQPDRNDFDQLDIITLLCHCFLLVIHSFIFVCAASAFVTLKNINSRPVPGSRIHDNIPMNLVTSSSYRYDVHQTEGSSFYESIGRQSTSGDSAITTNTYQSIRTFTPATSDYHSESHSNSTNNRFPPKRAPPLKILY